MPDNLPGLHDSPGHAVTRDYAKMIAGAVLIPPDIKLPAECTYKFRVVYR